MRRIRHLERPIIGTIAFLVVALPASAIPVKIRAGVIKGDGKVTPVARRVFVVVPYPANPRDLFELVVMNHRLTPPDQAKYRKRVRVNEGTDWREFTAPSFSTDYSKWIKGVLARVNKYKEKQKKPISAKTNLDGVAEVDLSIGKWWVVGSYEDNFSKVKWNHELNVSRGKGQLLELANDNAVGFEDWSIPVVPEIMEDKVWRTDFGKFLDEKARAEKLQADLDEKQRLLDEGRGPVERELAEEKRLRELNNAESERRLYGLAKELEASKGVAGCLGVAVLIMLPIILLFFAINAIKGY